MWYKDANPVEPSSTVGIFNDGTELRISTIRHDDIGDYTCIARNGEGQVSHTARVIIAGGAVIMVSFENFIIIILFWDIRKMTKIIWEIMWKLCLNLRLIFFLFKSKITYLNKSQ